VTREEIEALAASVAPIVAAEVAQQLVDRIIESRARRLVDAAELASVLGVEREWVYEHQDQLGVIRLGDGRRPRLRFERTRALEAFEGLSTARNPVARGRPRSPVARPRRPHRSAR
jgi:hypothetical protein